MYLSGGKIGPKPFQVRAYEFVMAVFNFIVFFFMSMVPGQSLGDHHKVLERSRKGGGGGGGGPNIHGVGKGQSMYFR